MWTWRPPSGRTDRDSIFRSRLRILYTAGVNTSPRGDALRQALESLVPASTQIVDVRSTLLKGGFVAARVMRHDVSIDRITAPISLVQKYTSTREIAVTRQLLPLAETLPLPRYRAHGVDDDGEWLLVDFIPGERRADSLDCPPDVQATLAAVHTRFADHLTDRPDLPLWNTALWLEMLDHVDAALATAPWPSQSGAQTRLRDAVEQLRQSAAVPATLAALPATLLHGDVHGGNMIANPRDGRVYLFDWGNARIGPAAIDVVNGCSSPEAPQWVGYWEHVRRWTGHQPHAAELRAAFRVGRIAINVQYLPFAIAHLGVARAEAMIDEALRSARPLP